MTKLFWLNADSLSDLDNLPALDALSAEIGGTPEAALGRFKRIAERV